MGKLDLYSGKPVTADYVAGSAVTAGDVIVVNGLPRIAHLNIAAGVLGALAVLGGIYNGVKDSSNISDGSALYWDADGDPVGGTAGTGALTTTSAGNTHIGYATKAAGVSDGLVELVHNPIVAALRVESQVTAALIDPGNAGAIPVTRSGHVPLVTTGAQTRTIAAPTFTGQELLLFLKTDGGDCVVTVPTGINQNGNNTKIGRAHV